MLVVILVPFLVFIAVGTWTTGRGKERALKNGRRVSFKLQKTWRALGKGGSEDFKIDFFFGKNNDFYRVASDGNKFAYFMVEILMLLQLEPCQLFKNANKKGRKKTWTSENKKKCKITFIKVRYKKIAGIDKEFMKKQK